MAIIALIILAGSAVTGGVLGGFYEGSLYSNVMGQNQEAKNGDLSFWDRFNNVLLGATLGLAVGSALVMLLAGGVAVAAGGATVAVGIGGTAGQLFAIGALGFNAFLLASMFWSTSELDLIELPTTQLP